MGSPCELALYLDDESATNIVAEIRQLIDRLEAKYSRYQTTSILSQINASAGNPDGFSVDEETQGILNYAKVLYEQSDGYFDITSGILRKIWDFKEAKIPTDEQREAALAFVGWQKINWTPPILTIPSGMELDLGGIVKEYAADAVANFCRQQNIHHGLVNLGGDIHVIGPHFSGKPWVVGIQNPHQAKKAVAKLEIFQGAIATSGDYERCIVIDGKRYSHLLNPFTAHPIFSNWASVSVIAPQCVVAGSFSTIALLKSEKSNDWLEESGLAYLRVTQSLELEGTILHQTLNPSDLTNSDEILINN